MRLRILANTGNIQVTAFTEVAFGGVAAPVQASTPPMLALLCLALAGIGFAKRKNIKN